MIINRFFLFRKLIHSVIFAFCYHNLLGMTQEISKGGGDWKREIVSNDKLQYLFQKWFQSFNNEHNTN